MKDVFQIAAVAAITYFAVKQINKRKTKVATTTKPMKRVSRDMLAAELQEEGEEGMIMTESQNQQLGASKSDAQPLNWNSANGWEDTNVLSYGI